MSDGFEEADDSPSWNDILPPKFMWEYGRRTLHVCLASRQHGSNLMRHVLVREHRYQHSEEEGYCQHQNFAAPEVAGNGRMRAENRLVALSVRQNECSDDRVGVPRTQ